MAILLAVIGSTPGDAVAGDCFGGWDEEQPYTVQSTTCGPCLGCCEITFYCRLHNGGRPYFIQSERSACLGQCATDWCG